MLADAEAAARKKARKTHFDRQNEALKAKLIKQADDEGTVNMRKVLGKDAEGKSDAGRFAACMTKGVRRLSRILQKKKPQLAANAMRRCRT